MKRALPFIAAAIPFAVLAAASAGSGQVLEVNHYDATNSLSYINAAACAEASGQKLLSLEWDTITTDSSNPNTGTYTIYASNKEPDRTAAAGANQNFCAQADDPNVSPPIKAGEVDSASATGSRQSLTVSAVTAATKAGFTCGTTSENDTVWICAHWFNQASERKGYAIGKFIIQVAAPAAPTGVNVGRGDGRLVVSWTASAGGVVDPNYYIATATAGGQTFSSPPTSGTTATISGLVNGTVYSVVVVAYSVGGNPSPASDPPVDESPVPSADFWKTYKDRGGVESGGCSSGPPDLLALAGAVSLLALRRRKQ